MQQQIRVGVVGFGPRGTHLFGYAVEHFEGVQAIAICEVDTKRLEHARQAHPHTALFSDFDKMLSESALDAILVETPATCHADFCVRALEHGIHVISDIPPVANMEEANRLWEADAKSTAIFMTGANPNMAAWIETVEDLRSKELLGDPYYIECEYIHDCRSLWAESPWRSTLEVIKYCTHDLGPVLRILDEDLEWVSCFDTGSHVNRVEGQHDAMVALFRTRSNVVVRFMSSFINNRPTEGHQIRIYTTKGYFELLPPYLKAENGANVLFHSTELKNVEGMTPLHIPSVGMEYQAFSKSGHGGWDHIMFDKFFAAIRSGGPSPIPLKEGLRMSLPGIVAAESARRGGELLPIEYPWKA